ncbi:MAG TPA: tetratricopeptide repeat protein [Longimicrobium sp.]|jgi:predicted negative regulator of RcsB-dependent stress response|uniref:tetratricopeptide repeat protein n=1 Tax=Longimicrobium sp. TaxID=2029185 RepID=UPI002EDA5822
MASSTAARSRQLQNSLNSDDAAALRAAELAAWARRNAKVILTVAGIVAVLAIGYVYYRMDRARRHEAAATQFLALSQNPTVATAAGAGQVEQFIKRHDGTTEADQARLLLAEIRMNAGQPGEAVKVLQPMSQKSGALSAQGAMMLGSAQAQAGNRAAAITAYNRAAELAALPYQRVEALGQAALMHEQSGDFKGAAAIYTRLLADAEEGSPQATVLQMRLAEVQARAGGR